jgi:rhodanese-related sulfurtransferase
MMKRTVLLLFALAAALSTFAAAGKWGEISHDELKQAVAAGQVALIDVNGSDSYAQGHIPGAIDYAASKSQLASLLPADKSALVVAYCGSPKCGAYKQGAEAAAKLGYTNVRHYVGGISGWKQAGEKVAKK